MKRIFISLLSGLYFGWAVAGTAAVIQVKSTQSSFQVSLPSNPSTGFQWTVQAYDKQLLKLTGSHYEAEKTNRIGSGGKMVFDFTCKSKVERPAQTTLSFAYARSWEKQAVKTSQINVVFER